MLEFNELTLNDIKVIKPFLTNSKTRLCDWTTGGIFLWRDFYKTRYAVESEVLYLKVNLGNKTAFAVPVTDAENIKEEINAVGEYCKNNGLPVIFCAVSECNLRFFEGQHKIINSESNRDWFDYLYNSEDIVSLAGKKYSGQRNHINRFKKLYPDYRFEPLNSSNIEHLKNFLDGYYSENSLLDLTLQEEKIKIYELAENYDTYGLLGGAIFVEDKIIAFSVGEIINDTLNINTEKADKNFHGSYQMIVNEFAKYYVNAGVLYINREDDMGSEGLRTSKLSYHPVRLLKKFNVEIDF